MRQSYFLSGLVLFTASLLWFFPVSCTNSPVTIIQPPVTIYKLVTATDTPTGSPTSTFTLTTSPTSTYTPVTILSTSTFTPTGSATSTFTLTSSPTSTYTPVTILSTSTFTPTGSATPTFTLTNSPTITPSPTSTFTPVTILVTATFSETFTCTNSPTMTITPTATNSPTTTPTGTPTNCSSFGGAGNGSNTLYGPNHTICSAFTLSILATMKDLRVELTNAATGYSINLAIYDDVSGSPGNLIIQGTPQLMAPGWNQMPLPDTPLNPGTYWLAVKSSGPNVGLVLDETQVSQMVYRLSDPWNGGNYPSSYSGNYSATNNKVSVRADYCVYPGTTPPSTATPTYTFTATSTPTETGTPTNSPTATPTKTPCGASGTLGNLNPGSNTGTGISNGYFIYSPYVAPASGALRQVSLLVQAQGGDMLQLLIYDNSGGQMTNLVSSSGIYTFPAYTGSSPITLTLPLSDYTITSGQTYYVGTYTYPSFLNGISYVVGLSSPSPGYWATGAVTSPASFGPSTVFSTYPLSLSVEFCQ